MRIGFGISFKVLESSPRKYPGRGARNVYSSKSIKSVRSPSRNMHSSVEGTRSSSSLCSLSDSQSRLMALVSVPCYSTRVEKMEGRDIYLRFLRSRLLLQ